jgi:hypothetical protein
MRSFGNDFANNPWAGIGVDPNLHVRLSVVLQQQK